MLHLEAADEGSLGAFFAVSEASPYRMELREYAESQLQLACAKPEWCVVAREAEEPVHPKALSVQAREPLASSFVPRTSRTRIPAQSRL
jgi:hypothetical protein